MVAVLLYRVFYVLPPVQLYPVRINTIALVQTKASIIVILNVVDCSKKCQMLVRIYKYILYI